MEDLEFARVQRKFELAGLPGELRTCVGSHAGNNVGRPKEGVAVWHAGGCQGSDWGGVTSNGVGAVIDVGVSVFARQHFLHRLLPQSHLPSVITVECGNRLGDVVEDQALCKHLRTVTSVDSSVHVEEVGVVNVANTVANGWC